MQINIVDAQLQTTLFIIFLIAFIALTLRKDPNPYELNYMHTDELKGIAILMVLFAHIGYFLFTDNRFLYPLSIGAGVGVNIFLLLSGFGLTTSENKSQLKIIQFYKKRLKGIFIPMWLVLALTLLLDYFLLNKTYNLLVILRSIFGFFPVANIYNSINSPLWYFSLILFYYLIFPLFYRKNRALLSILLVFFLSFIMVNIKLPVIPDVLKLYKLHYMAFPLGMLLAYVNEIKLGTKIKAFLLGRFSNKNILGLLRYIVIFSLTFLFVYTAIHSGVGKKIIFEQVTSLITVVTLVLIFLLKDIQSNLLIAFGKYSYEIYLIQWPLMYRYDFIYKHTPAFLGTLLYLAVFIIIGFLIDKIIKLTINHKYQASTSKNRF